MTPKQAKAAQLLGRGLSCRVTARELHVSERTLTRWRKVPGFSEAERRAHQEHVGEIDGIRTVLENALIARKRNGEPDYATRLRAAALLLGQPPEPAEPPKVLRQYVYRDRIEELERAAS